MPSITYSRIGDGEFTKELLDQNFAAIGEYTVAMEKIVDDLIEKSNAMSADITAMAKIVSTINQQKSNVVPFMLGAAAGVYLYSRFRVRWQVGQRNGEFGEGPKKEDPIKTEAHRADQPNA